MIDFNIPVSGMTQAEESVNQIAQRLVKPAADLAPEMVALVQAQDAFAIDVTVSQTEDEMTRHALSILA
jgi:hypothetical protein